MSTTAHEDFSRGDQVKGSSDRSFGLVFVVFFLVIALLPLRHQQGVRYWALGVSAALLVVSLAIPRVLSPANYLWTQLALLLHKVVSPVAMGIIFFGVAAPTALLMRLFGKDLLRLHWDPAASSYWLKRTPPGPVPQTMLNQF